jgi:gliding motility-associated-like protein
MAIPSRFLWLCLVGLMLAIDAGAHESCTNCKVLVFKENKGQWDQPALFITQLQSGTVFLSHDSITFALDDTADMNRVRHGHHPWVYQDGLDLTLHTHVFRQVFENANPDVRMTGSDKLTEYFNYYIGNDPHKWASHVNGYYDVTYNNLYNNIDLLVSSQWVNMKYNFIVKPGGNPAAIKINYEGADDMQLVNGDLVLKTSIGPVTDLRPYAYQMVNGERRQVGCEFRMEGSHVWFDFPDGYDKASELFIDPTLIFSTFSGSNADNFGYSATYDSHGNAYAAGSVFQYNGRYPTTTGAFQTSWAGGVGFGNIGQYDGTGTDVSVTKYDSFGVSRIYSTYLGGDHDELPHSLIVNSNDELFVLGSTASDNFPVTAGAFQTTFHGGQDMGVFQGIGVHYLTGSDIFITHFNIDGTALLGSTYVGGSGNDGLTYPEYVGLNYNYADDVRGEIAIDGNGNVYVASTSRSADFPVTPGAYQTVKADSSDAVVFKMDGYLTHMIWGTFLGGNDNDAAYSLDFDPNGDLYIAGGTISTDFPVTAGVVQATNHGGRADGFITHLSRNGNALLQSTYWGSNQYDQNYFVRTDNLGNAYVFGQTEATDTTFIHHALYNKPNGGQFITKFNAKLDTIIWSTTFGTGKGTPDISPTAFLVDYCNKTYISGWGSNFYRIYNIAGAPALTTGGLQVTPGAIQTTTDSNDFYVMVMMNDASALSYATYFGSPTDEDHVDGGTSRFDRRGIIYQSACAGCNGQSSFPTTAGVVSRTNNSANCNNAVFKINFNLPIAVAAFRNSPTGCVPANIVFTNQSQGNTNPSYYWTFGDGGTSTASNPSHIYTLPGIYTVQLIVDDPSTCNFTDTITHQVLIISNSAADTIPTINICSPQQVQIGIQPSFDTAIQYTWIPASYLSQANVSNPFATPPSSMLYTLIVSNGLCADTFRQKIQIDAKTPAAFTNTPTGCVPATIAFTNQSQGGNTSPSYHWNFGDGSTSTASDPSHVYTQSGLYTVQLIVDGPPPCLFADTITHQVVIISNGAMDTLPTVHICSSQQVQIGIQPILDTAIHYTWAPASYLTQTNISNPFSYPPVSTLYTLVLSNGICSDTFTQKVQIDTNTLSVQSKVLDCVTGDTTTLTALCSPPGTYTYSWRPASQIVSGGNTATAVVVVSQTTEFTVVATNANGCPFTDSASVVMIADWPTVYATATPDTIMYGDTSQLNITYTNVTSFYWNADTTLSSTHVADPLAYPIATTTYTINVADTNGCKAKKELTVHIIYPPCAGSKLFIPNAFSPNNDGKNDVLFVRGNLILDMYFAVYDRWGQKMFETRDLNNGWDGTYDGQKLAPAVFGWYLEGTCESGEKFFKKGNVTLLR